jgi:hypothetical protein
LGYWVTLTRLRQRSIRVLLAPCEIDTIKTIMAHGDGDPMTLTLAPSEVVSRERRLQSCVTRQQGGGDANDDDQWRWVAAVRHPYSSHHRVAWPIEYSTDNVRSIGVPCDIDVFPAAVTSSLSELPSTSALPSSESLAIGTGIETTTGMQKYGELIHVACYGIQNHASSSSSPSSHVSRWCCLYSRQLVCYDTKGNTCWSTDGSRDNSPLQASHQLTPFAMPQKVLGPHRFD